MAKVFLTLLPPPSPPLLPGGLPRRAPRGRTAGAFGFSGSDGCGSGGGGLGAAASSDCAFGSGVSAAAGSDGPISRPSSLSIPLLATDTPQPVCSTPARNPGG